MDRFDTLLQELGQILGVPLHTDKHFMCAIQVKNRFKVQLQIDSTQEKLLMISKVGEPTAGKFREEVLKHALLANNLPSLRVGNFAYLSISNSLVLYQRYPIDLFNGEKLASQLLPFISLVEKWHDAISLGQLDLLQA